MSLGYAERVNRLRIFEEPDGTWSIDGLDDDTGYFTEPVWNYDSHADAYAALPDFARALSEDYGVAIVRPYALTDEGDLP